MLPEESSDQEAPTLVIIQHDPSIPYPPQWLPLYEDFPHFLDSHIQQADAEVIICIRLLSPLPFSGPPPKGTLKRVKRTLIRYKHLLNLLAKHSTFHQGLPNQNSPHPSLELFPQPTSPSQLLDLCSSGNSHLVSQQGTLLDAAASRFPHDMFQKILFDINTAPVLPTLAHGSAHSH